MQQNQRNYQLSFSQKLALWIGAFFMLFHATFFSMLFLTGYPALSVAQLMVRLDLPEALIFFTSTGIMLGLAMLIGGLAAMSQFFLVRRAHSAVAWLVLASHAALFSMLIYGGLTDT